MPKLKRTLDILTESGVISQLDRPTDWVNSILSLRCLDEESFYLCTFNTQFGKYKFNHLHFGICSASDADKFTDIPGVHAVNDDIIVNPLLAWNIT